MSPSGCPLRCAGSSTCRSADARTRSTRRLRRAAPRPHAAAAASAPAPCSKRRRESFGRISRLPELAPGRPSQPGCLAQRLVDARLPAGTGGPEMGQDLRVQPDVDGLLGRRLLRPADRPGRPDRGAPPRGSPPARTTPGPKAAPRRDQPICSRQSGFSRRVMELMRHLGMRCPDHRTDALTPGGTPAGPRWRPAAAPGRSCRGRSRRWSRGSGRRRRRSPPSGPACGGTCGRARPRRW